jgi:uncharacterized protein (TIGR03067 family)
MIARLLASCVVASLCASSLIAQDATQADLAKLQGNWKPAATEFKGKDVIPIPAVTYSIDGSEYTSKSDEQKVRGKVAFRIDASTNPKTIDLTLRDGKVSLGIYKLDGDTLTICRETGSGVRPADFKTTNKDGSLSFWKRIGF